MLIVACQVCGDSKVLAGAPDEDGLARTCWICPCCGSGQVVQLEVPTDGRSDLRNIVLGMKMEIRAERVTLCEKE
ncbi:MAG: alcohol dehydrogenase [Synergistaceae bacterium]|nr:alcohol dehydrogenase [Synergistaceae bacterium]